MTTVDPKHVPVVGSAQFQCPQCNVVAQQVWSDIFLSTGRIPGNPYTVALNSGVVPLGNYQVSCCYVCRKLTFWVDGKIEWPSPNQILPASDDMPPNVKNNYDEARAVYHLSPKSAAALLRLAIQHLCVDLGGAGNNINDDIAKLVDHGLPIKIQQALDVVRVIGNNAVHPGLIAIDDNPQIVVALFKLVNLIVENMITQPAEVKTLFEALPSGAKDAIVKRDA